MKYVKARYAVESREEKYRIYVTDALRALGNFTNIPRYYDFAYGNPADLLEAQKPRDPEQVKAGILNGLKRLRGE